MVVVGVWINFIYLDLSLPGWTNHSVLNIGTVRHGSRAEIILNEPMPAPSKLNLNQAAVFRIVRYVEWVINLRYRANGRARLWEVDFWSSIGTERFNIPALPAAKIVSKAREDLPEPETPVNKAIARRFQVNILQVVLPSSANAKLNELSIAPCIADTGFRFSNHLVW